MDEDSPSPKRNVTLTLTPDEALVLFALLSRWEAQDTPNVPIEHQAERRVLWDIQCMLESALAEPFMANYHDLVDQARNALHDDEG